MGFEQAQDLYDIVRHDPELARSLFRQALQDPEGTLDRLVDIAEAKGLSVSRQEIRDYLNDSADDAARQWILKARGGL